MEGQFTIWTLCLHKRRRWFTPYAGGITHVNCFGEWFCSRYSFLSFSTYRHLFVQALNRKEATRYSPFVLSYLILLTEPICIESSGTKESHRSTLDESMIFELWLPDAEHKHLSEERSEEPAIVLPHQWSTNEVGGAVCKFMTHPWSFKGLIRKWRDAHFLLS
ncbi:hypothetical protein TNCV_2895711 [Trichonephila clavipes]|nr:hypothetical protein TNCV_2895711 [Trichonephila clavipes]